jgi:hypothetical protein
MKAALKWEEDYAKAIDEAVKKNEDFINSLNTMIATLAGLDYVISA